MSGPYSDVCTNDLKKLWENGIVPYVFDDNVSLELKKSVWKAMRRISRAGPIKFVKRKNQKDYIKIVEKGGYWSYVGKQGGEQVITVLYYPIIPITISNSHFISNHKGVIGC